MERFASIVILGFAAVLIIGGHIGWRRSGSRMSFTSGLASAALLATANAIARRNPMAGYGMALLVTLALSGFFTLRFRKSRKFVPAGVMLAVCGVVLAALGWALQAVASG